MDAVTLSTRIKKKLASDLKLDVELIEDDVQFDEYGVDSMVAVHMTVELSELLKRKVSPELLFKYNTVSSLANHLARGGR